jgi:hypothetical protein
VATRGDGDGLTAALNVSRTAFNDVAHSLTAATSAEQVDDGAAGTITAVARINTVLKELGSASGPKETAVRDQLVSEQALLLALGKLDGIAAEPLKTWGESHAGVTTAAAAESNSRAVLRRYDPDAARSLADTGILLTKITTAVSPALVKDVTDEATRLLNRLQAAKNTGELRGLGRAAATNVTAVTAAANELPSGDGKQVLKGYVTAVRAFAGLSKIDAEHSSSWTPTRTTLAKTFGDMARAAGSPSGDSVQLSLNSALAAADAVVRRASAALLDWKTRTAAAIKARTTHVAALESYAASVRTAAATYTQQRRSLSRHLAKEVNYSEDSVFLAQALNARRNVHSALESAGVPGGLTTAHQNLVAPVERSISSLQAGYAVLQEFESCYFGCTFYRDSSRWKQFVSASKGPDTTFAAALTSWESAVAAERTELASRPLPPKPLV